MLRIWREIWFKWFDLCDIDPIIWPGPELENYKKDCLDAFVVLCDDDEGDEDDKYDEDDEDDYLWFDFWTFVLLSLLHDNEIGEASPLVGLEGI